MVIRYSSSISLAKIVENTFPALTRLMPHRRGHTRCPGTLVQPPAQPLPPTRRPLAWMLLPLQAALAMHTAAAATAVEPYQEYSQKVRAAQQLSSLDDGLFGDSVSLFNGGTEFSVADISLPGNDGLPVELRRRLNVVAEPVIGYVDRFGGAGNWDVDVPSISGVVDASYKWNTNSLGQPKQRCAERLHPETGTQARLRDIFHGFTIRIPGAGSKALLIHEASTFPKLGEGTAGLWTTRDLDGFTCTPMKNGYPGDGFIMHTPNGMKYVFDVGVERSISKVQGRNYTTRSRVQVFLLASRIEDRFGNSVAYHYDAEGYPQRIVASDGREITLTYSNGQLSQAAANGRLWLYGYSGNTLASVVLPDQSAWRYGYSGSLRPLYEMWDAELGPGCMNSPPVTDAAFALSATHPSGAQGQFEFRHLRHPRSGVRKSVCVIDVPGVGGEPHTYYLGTPNYYDMFSLVSKTISGPGLDTPLAWQYRYGSGRSALWGSAVPVPYTPCTDRKVCSVGKTSSIVQPDGSTDLYRYGMQYGVNEGVLLGKRRVAPDGTVAREETYEYVSDDEVTSQPFSARYGGLWGGDDVSTIHVRPLKRSVIAQDGYISSADPDAPPTSATSRTDAQQDGCQGTGCETWFNLPQQASVTASSAGQQVADTYVEEVQQFDSYARPLRYRRYSSLGYSRVDAQEYHDNLGRWVLGQTARATVDDVETSRTEFDANTALPVHEFSFGRRTRSFGYYPNGTVATLTDGNARVTTLENWYRGSPQLIRHPDGSTQSAVVDANGWVLSATDENGYTTGYGYDGAGRITGITYPGNDDVAWNSVAARFEQVQAPELGLDAGHWRHTATVGQQKKTTYFDAFWRPVAESLEDTASPAQSQRWQARRYDSNGRNVFESYPRNPAADGALPFNAAMPGSHKAYDTLGRVIETRQDSELGALVTRTDYLGELLVRTVNPRNQATVTSHQAYHQPGYDLPRDISMPEGIFMDIGRDVFGRVTSLRRRNGDASQSVWRRYVYDAHGQLCKQIEPENGSTVMEYDAAGNMIWTVNGLDLSDAAACNRAEAYASGRRIDRSYDARNRISTLVFPDGRGNQSFSYWPDGLARSITTQNDSAGQQLATNTFQYNGRRLLRAESVDQGAGQVSSIGYGYDGNGNLSHHVLPSGRVLNYAPNALGQASGVWEQATGLALADRVSYYANGAIKSFFYGNGIPHTLQLNARQLPQRSTDAGVLDIQTVYDAAGNTTQLLDTLRGAQHDRSLSYDGVDRLIEARSCSFGGDCVHRFSYDALDNIASWQLGGIKQHFYWYDSKNRLSNIKNEAGSTVVGLGYDVQGNLNNKNGQGYEFDYGNRLRTAAGKESYRYDSQGRRLSSLDQNGGEIRSLYSYDGVLRRTEDLRKGQDTEYAYLGGSLIARLVAEQTPTAPAPPVLVMPAYSNSGTYTAQWNQATGATRYELQEQAEAGDWLDLYSGSATQYVISGRTNGSYSYRLRACATACGSWGAVQSTAVALPPSGDPILTAPAFVVGGNYVVGWSAVSGAGEYTLEEGVEGGAWLMAYTGTALTHAVSGKPGGHYHYRAKACNPAGCGTYSEVRTVEVLGAPTTAPVLSMPAYTATGAFDATWNVVAGASSYELEQQQDGGPWARAYFQAQNSATISGLATGTYRFRVKGCNGAGCGPESDPVSLEVLVPPAAPALNAPAGSNSPQYVVGWTAAPTATGYVLEESANSGVWTQVYNGAALSTSLTGRGNGSYRYRAQACNSSGCGDYSGIATTSVLLPPATPRITISTRTGAPRILCAVSWTTSPTTNRYELMAQSGVVQYAGPNTHYSHVTAACSPTHVVRACSSAGCSDWSSPPTPQIFEPGDSN